MHTHSPYREITDSQRHCPLVRGTRMHVRITRMHTAKSFNIWDFGSHFIKRGECQLYEPENIKPSHSDKAKKKRTFLEQNYSY